jgi:hypothetical protein
MRAQSLNRLSRHVGQTGALGVNSANLWKVMVLNDSNDHALNCDSQL